MPTSIVTGKAASWVDAPTRGVEGKFTNGDAHAVRSEVAQAKDALAVRDDDHPHTGMRPVTQHLGNPSTIGRGDKQSLGSAKNVPVFLARLADSGCVDQRHHLIDVLGQHAIEELFVPNLEGYQENVTLDVGWLFSNITEDPVHLFVLGVNSRRKEATQAQDIAFAFRKGRSFVQARAIKNFHSARDGVLFHFIWEYAYWDQHTAAVHISKDIHFSDVLAHWHITRKEAAQRERLAVAIVLWLWASFWDIFGRPGGGRASFSARQVSFEELDPD